MEIRYSDGNSVERLIGELLKKSSDNRSTTSIAAHLYDSHWPVRYHLTPERANLFRPFCFKNLRVLEIGAGMGALSRYLAEEASQLFVVEGTQPRFENLKNRLRDLNNWDGWVGNFQNFTSSQKFDVVCVIGVLEYSQLYWSGEKPFENLLKKAADFLNEEGVLILAIENKMGLKYFNGAPEDHTGLLFDSLTGYGRNLSPRTFSRKELKNCISESGLYCLEEFFPFPDYKLPTSVINLRLLDNLPELSGELASVENYQRENNLFPQRLAFSQMSEAGLLAEHANSFLWLLGKKNSPKTLSQLYDSRIWAWHFSKNRKSPIVTRFHAESSGMRIEKTLICEKEEKGPIQWNSTETGLIAGEALSKVLLSRLYFEDWNAFETELLEFFQKMIEKWRVSESELHGKAVDALFTNCKIQFGEYQLFDLEWQWKGPIPIHWFVLRNLMALRDMLSYRPQNTPVQKLSELYALYCSRLRISLNLEEAIQLEAELQSHVCAFGSPIDFGGAIRRELEAPFSQRSPRSISDLWSASELINVFHTATSAKVLLRKTASLWKPWLKRNFGSLKKLRRKKHERRFSGWIRISAKMAQAEEIPISVTFNQNVFTFKLLHSRKFWTLLKTESPPDSYLAPPGVELITVALPRWRILVLSLWGQRQELLKPKELVALAKRWILSYRKNGWRGIVFEVRHQVLLGNITTLDYYDSWLKKYGFLSEEKKEKIKRSIHAMPESRPLISLILPVYNPEIAHLNEAIQSICNQLYPNWELCISDDASTHPAVKPVLEKWKASDPRIRLHFREKNGHISHNTNSALKLAAGDFVAFMDQDDLLSVDALYEVAKNILANPKAELLYSDEDKVHIDGKRFAPHFKPDWNPELFYSYNMVTHLLVIRRKCVEELGGLRPGFEGAQDYDLVLRAMERLSRENILHIPKILYHWRAIPGSTAFDIQAKSYAWKNSCRAIEEHFQRRGVKATVKPVLSGCHQIQYALPNPLPKVSVIIGTRDKAHLLRNIVNDLNHKTNFSVSEILIIDNQSVEAETFSLFKELLKDPKVRILRYDAPFNFSAINNYGAEQSQGNVLAFLNNDLRVQEPEWLSEMVRFAIQPHIGAVGAKLLYPSQRIQHAGIILGIGKVTGFSHGVAGHSHKGKSALDTDYMGRTRVNQCISAVTGACLIIRKELFEKVGGFDENSLPVAFNDVDLCLKLLTSGYYNVYTPFAELIHLESESRGSDQTLKNFARFEKECHFMMGKWGEFLKRDPNYNPNLTLETQDFAFAFDERLHTVE